MKSTPRRLRVGVAGIGLDAYWSQFAGLERRLIGYLQTLENKIAGEKRTIINLGLVDSNLGLDEEALANDKQGLALRKDTSVVYRDLSFDYLNLNRLEEAKSVLSEARTRKLDGSLTKNYYQLAFLTDDAAEMTRAVSASGKSGAEPEMLAIEADTEAFHGRLRAANEISRLSISAASREGDKESAADAESIVELEQPRRTIRRRRSPFDPAPQESDQSFIPWLGAAITAGVLLIAQVIHQNRDWLAAHAPLGGSLRALYSTMGAPVAPPANLSAYQLRQWGVTGDPAGDGTLRVRASILNTAAQLEPYPLLRVTLANRFGGSIGTRDFEPSEYLGKPTAKLLAPGERADATLDILDPGKNAEGFEIDVCLRGADRKVSCANDKAPAQAKR